MELKTSFLFALLSLLAIVTARAQEEGTTPPPAGTRESEEATPPTPSSPATDEGPAAFPDRQGTLEAFAAYLTQRSKERREKAVAAVGTEVEELTWSYETNEGLLEPRMDAIVAKGALVTDYLLERLVEGTPDDRERRNLRENIVRVLRRIADPGTIPGLIELLQHDNSRLRLHAMDALAVFEGNAEVATAILSRLEDPQEEVRLRAIATLGAIAHEPAAEIIARILKTTSERNVQVVCAKALAKLHSKAAEEVARALFRSTQDDTLLRPLARYFRSAQISTAVDDLVDKLGAISETETLVEILDTIGRLDPSNRRDIAERIHPMVDHRRADVRFAAARALHRIGDRRGLAILLEQPEATIEKNRSQPFGYVYRARVYRELEEWKLAVIDYQTATKRAKRGQLDKDVFLEYAECYAQQRLVDRAFRILKEGRITPAEFRESSLARLPIMQEAREEARYSKWFEDED